MITLATITVLSISAARAQDEVKVAAIRMCGASVLSASMISDQYTGRSTATFRLDDAASKKFARATTRAVGRTIAVTLNGRIISSPWVHEPILNGQFYITGPDEQVLQRIVGVASNPC